MNTYSKLVRITRYCQSMRLDLFLIFHKGATLFLVALYVSSIRSSTALVVVG